MGVGGNGAAALSTLSTRETGRLSGRSLQKMDGAMGTRFCVGQCMMMMLKIIAAGCSDGLELMIGQILAEMLARGGAGVVERIVRIVHLVDLMDGLEASLVERTIMRHEWQAFDHWDNFVPDIRKHRRFICVFRGKAVYLLAKPLMIIRLRMDQ